MELDELTEEFVVESKEHLESIEDEFLKLESQCDSPDFDLIAKVFRAIHSVKGAAGFFGLTNINDLSHAMETLLSMMREGEIKPEAKYIDHLLVGVDFLNRMLDDLENSNDCDISEPLGVLNLLIKNSSETAAEDMETVVTVGEIDEEGGPKSFGFEIDMMSLKHMHKPGCFLYELKYDLNNLEEEETGSPLDLVHELLALGEILDGKLSTPALDFSEDMSGLPLYYELLYSTVLDETLISHAVSLPDDCIRNISDEINNVSDQVHVEDVIDEVMHDQIELDKELDAASKLVDPADTDTQKVIQPDVVKETSTKASTEKSSASIRIKLDILEELMRLAGELVLVRNQQLLLTEDSEPEVKSITQRLDLVTTELQESIMRTRMQPIGNVFNKVPRIIRDLSKKLGKQIELTISGNDVEMDKTILESLADPITHMIRNCCDHAIESPEDRVAAGKPEVGDISLRAYHESGHVVIEIEDNGRGLNPDGIRANAFNKGMHTEAELNAMSVKEIQGLIMQPGFSTAAEVSEVSGRGVGMDVVRSSIERLGGSVYFETTVGEGTKFILSLPLTLAIIPCLIIKVEGERFAIPQVNLEELVCLYDDEVATMIETTGDLEVYRLRNRLLPMVRLSEVLSRDEPFTAATRSQITQKYSAERKSLQNDYNRARTENDREKLKSLRQALNFAVVKVSGKSFGIIIDEVIGTEEIVVKPMHSYLKNLHCYGGATVMGDGEVALILNIDGVADYTGVDMVNVEDLDYELEVSSTEIVEETQEVLMFKSSETEQFAVPLPLIKRIERISSNDIQMVGSNEFITIDGVSTHILRLESVLSVAPTSDQDEMFLLLPKHTQKPYGVLFTTLLDVCQAGMNVDTSSFVADGVLGTSIINEIMTIFLDVYRVIEIKSEQCSNEKNIQIADSSSSAKRILLAEDTPFFQNMVKGYLETEGYSVALAENGQIALDLFKAEEFDMIVSDLEMPEMDGYEFMKQVRLSGSKIPALALSSLNKKRDVEKAKASGFNKYNLKVNLDRLVDNINDLAML